MLVHLVDCYGRCFLCQGKQCGLPEGKPVPHADVAMLGSQAISGMTEKNGVFEYSQKLSQQVLTLEADNVELQDAKKVLDADNQLLKAKVQELQLQCEKLRDTSIYTHQDKEAAILQAREVLQSKQAEVMLARKSTEDVKQHAEALATDNMRLNGIAEKLQQERSELQRTVHAQEASIKSFQTELNQRAVAEGNSLKMRNALEQRLEDMPTVLKLEKALSFEIDLVLLFYRQRLSQRIGEHEGKPSIFPQVPIAMSGRSVLVLAKPQKPFMLSGFLCWHRF